MHTFKVKGNESVTSGAQSHTITQERERKKKSGRVVAGRICGSDTAGDVYRHHFFFLSDLHDGV